MVMRAHLKSQQLSNGDGNDCWLSSRLQTAMI
jgi:hypothetical protein